MRFTADDKHLIIWMGVKKLCKKCMLKMFSTDEVFMGWRHWLKYQCDIFNFFDLCSGVGIVWLTTEPELESVMLLLSLYPLNVLTHWNSILCQETSSESGLLHTFFIYSRVFNNNNVISNVKCYCCNDTFSDIRFTLLLAKNI